MQVCPMRRVSRPPSPDGQPSGAPCGHLRQALHQLVTALRLDDPCIVAAPSPAISDRPGRAGFLPRLSIPIAVADTAAAASPGVSEYRPGVPIPYCSLLCLVN